MPAGTLSITSAVALSELTALVTALGASPNLVIYNGTAPTNAGTALSGNTVLATLACAATPISGYSFNATGGPNANGAEVATFAAIANATAAATGTATFWRLLTSGGTVIMQGSCGVSGTDMILNTTAFTSGSTVSVTSATISQPTGP